MAQKIKFELNRDTKELQNIEKQLLADDALENMAGGRTDSMTCGACGIAFSSGRQKKAHMLKVHGKA